MDPTTRALQESTGPVKAASDLLPVDECAGAANRPRVH